MKELLMNELEELKNNLPPVTPYFDKSLDTVIKEAQLQMIDEFADISAKVMDVINGYAIVVDGEIVYKDKTNK